jgi:hypothetical protein
VTGSLAFSATDYALPSYRYAGLPTPPLAIPGSPEMTAAQVMQLDPRCRILDHAGQVAAKLGMPHQRWPQPGADASASHTPAASAAGHVIPPPRGRHAR